MTYHGKHRLEDGGIIVTVAGLHERVRSEIKAMTVWPNPFLTAYSYDGYLKGHAERKVMTHSAITLTKCFGHYVVECACGWTQTASTKADAKWAYEHHAVRMSGGVK